MRLTLLLTAWACFATVAHAAPPDRPDFASVGKTSLLGIEAKGSKFVFVFDHSGSMGDPDNKPLNRAKEELTKAIDQLDAAQQFYIVFYNHEQRLFRIDATGGKLIFGTDTNKKLAGKFIDSIRAEGGTKHADALALALKMRPDVIFQLTDGDPPDDITSDELERLKRLNGSGTTINVIQISPKVEGEHNRLEELAKSTGGEHRYVDFSKSDDADKK